MLILIPWVWPLYFVIECIGDYSYNLVLRKNFLSKTPKEKSYKRIDRLYDKRGKKNFCVNKS